MRHSSTAGPERTVRETVERIVGSCCYRGSCTESSREDVMDIPLSPEQQQFINERLASGRNHTAQEAVAEALSLLQAQDSQDRARLEALRADIALGIASIDAGEGISGEEAFARLAARRSARQVQ
jgi:antitoxin ParD1/3/4